MVPLFRPSKTETLDLFLTLQINIQVSFDLAFKCRFDDFLNSQVILTCDRIWEGILSDNFSLRTQEFLNLG